MPDKLGAGHKAGLLAGVAGLSAVAGVTAAKALRQRKLIEDAYEGEDFALLDADRGCIVTTPDGTPLVVREVGPVTAPLTVVNQSRPSAPFHAMGCAAP